MEQVVSVPSRGIRYLNESGLDIQVGDYGFPSPQGE